MDGVLDQHHGSRAKRTSYTDGSGLGTGDLAGDHEQVAAGHAEVDLEREGQQWDWNLVNEQLDGRFLGEGEFVLEERDVTAAAVGPRGQLRFDHLLQL